MLAPTLRENASVFGRTTATRPVDHGLCQPRLLFVDDDPDIQTTLEMRLRPYAVQVDHAFFGAQGLSEAIKREPDLILMDFAMPNGNGEYLLETLKRNPATSAIPVVVFTGMRDPAIRKRVVRLGAEGFLLKPATMAQLLEQIGRFIDIRSNNDEEGVA